MRVAVLLVVIVISTSLQTQSLQLDSSRGSKRRRLAQSTRGMVSKPTDDEVATTMDPPSSTQSSSILSRLTFSLATPNDMEACYAIEKESFPPDEAASHETLQYRQEHARPYFLCAKQQQLIVGYVCATRCNAFTADAMAASHEPNGKLLAVHSVTVQKKYRRQGIATAMMKEYLRRIHIVKSANTTENAEKNNDDDDDASLPGLESVVLLAKSHLLGFYVQCGFTVIRPSPIVHGADLWYELEKQTGRSQCRADEQWFVKTEQFCRPFSEIQPHLKAHSAWVQSLRSKGYSITSGYRVDADDRPGGGGLMFLAAKNHAQAKEIVLQDPLVANGCVDWELHGWKSQVGNVQMR